MKKTQPPHRKFPVGDKSAFVTGIFLTVLALLFFGQDIIERLAEENQKPTAFRAVSDTQPAIGTEKMKRSQ